MSKHIPDNLNEWLANRKYANARTIAKPTITRDDKRMMAKLKEMGICYKQENWK